MRAMGFQTQQSPLGPWSRRPAPHHAVRYRSQPALFHALVPRSSDVSFERTSGKDHIVTTHQSSRSIRVLSVVALSAWASTIVGAHWGVQDAPADAQSRMYPSAKSGGNYMHNYYFPMSPSSTPWYPAWSPDGNRITVSMSGSIWNVDPETGIADELAFGSKYLSSPAWSPDGKTLVYTADDDNQTIQLEVLNLATG